MSLSITRSSFAFSSPARAASSALPLAATVCVGSIAAPELDRERLVRERRVARAQDLVAPNVDAELLLKRALNVDLGEHAEAFGLERFGDTLERLVVAGLECLAKA